MSTAKEGEMSVSRTPLFIP